MFVFDKIALVAVVDAVVPVPEVAPVMRCDSQIASCAIDLLRVQNDGGERKVSQKELPFKKLAAQTRQGATLGCRTQIGLG